MLEACRRPAFAGAISIRVEIAAPAASAAAFTVTEATATPAIEPPRSAIAVTAATAAAVRAAIALCARGQPPWLAPLTPVATTTVAAELTLVGAATATATKAPATQAGL